MEETWVSFEDGYLKRISKTFPYGHTNPLETGFVEDGSPYTHGLWISDAGRLAIRAGTFDWVPIPFGEAKLVQTLARLTQDWVHNYETSLMRSPTCCGDVAEFIVAPAAIVEARETVAWGKPPFHRELNIERGLIVEDTTARDGIVTQRLVNEILPTIDLTPPPNLQNKIATAPTPLENGGLLKAPTNLAAEQKFSFGFRIGKSPNSLGLVVAIVYEGGPAHLAGVRPQDRIMSIDGVSVESLSRHFSEEFREKDTVSLVVLRTGLPDRTITLRKVESATFAAAQ